MLSLSTIPTAEILSGRNLGARVSMVGGSDYVLSSQTEKLMAAINFSDYLGLKHYKKAKKLKHFIHLALAYWPQSFSSYHTISP